jgi:SAM-dependent methyltransferase
MASLHDLHTTTRFSNRAADYVKFRPSYPSAAIDAVLAGLDAPAKLRAADVGAGTGISARLLADRGVRVIAIEPNAEMRGAAQPHARVEWRDGRAEATGLADASVELVLCAQAFHWFEPVATLREFHRVLVPRGRVALMWNSRDFGDELTTGYHEAILGAGGTSVMESTPLDTQIFAREQFTPPKLTEFANQQCLDLAGLLGRARSASYAPNAGPAAERLAELLTLLHAKHRDADGHVFLRYVTRVYVSERS